MLGAMVKQHVLVLEDEPSILESVLYALESEGFTAKGVANCAAAHVELAQGGYDLLILDVGLPDGNGMDFCKDVRKRSNVPVIFLTARAGEVDRIVGLEIGGDDYVVKPFSPRELTARVKAVLRRVQGPSGEVAAAAAEAEVTSACGCISFDEMRRVAVFAGQCIALSATEWGLLRALVKHPGRIFSREQLMDLAWDDPGSALERTVDAHVRTLRQKLRSVSAEADVIHTHRGFGYSYQPV